LLGEPTLRPAIEDLRAAGVKLEHAPPSALADFISSRAPPRATSLPCAGAATAPNATASA